jgi:hypothetical protein
MNKEIIKFTIMLSLLLVFGFVGLAIWLVGASVIGLIEPIWWGGKALFSIYGGITLVALSSFLTSIAVATWMPNFRKKCISIVGGLQGFIASPLVWGIALGRQFIPELWIVNNYLSIFAVIAVSAAVTSIMGGLVILWRCRSEQP